MSLKAVHLVFVTALSALTFGCCAWKAHDYFAGAGARSDLVFSIAAFLTGVAVLIYGWVFLKKLKSISFL